MDVLHICSSYINFHRVHFHTFKFMQIQEAEYKFNSRTKYHKGYFILCFCIVAQPCTTLATLEKSRIIKLQLVQLKQIITNINNKIKKIKSKLKETSIRELRDVQKFIRILSYIF